MQATFRTLCATLLTLCLAASASVALAQSPSSSMHSEMAAIEAMLARGDDQAALPRVKALIDQLPDDASSAQRARLDLLLARTLDAGEKDLDGVIAAATRAIEGFRGDAAFTDAVLEARRLRGLAWTRQRNVDNALADLGEAERIMRERGDSGPVYAQVLSDLSLAQRIAADYGAALTSLDSAIAIFRKQVESNPVALTKALIRLGQTRRISGDLERAELAYREALALDEKSPDPSGRNQVTVLYALGNLARARAAPAQAIIWYAKALPGFERVYGADSLQMAMLLNNYGNAESEIPEHGEAAIARFQAALDIATRKNSKNVADFLPLANIAMVRIWQGRFKEAEAGFRAMLEHLRDAPAGAESSPLFSQHGLAAALWGQGRHAEAFDAATSAELTRQSAVREVASGLSDQQALDYQEQDYSTLDHALAIALDSKDTKLLERAWSLATSARGQVTAIQAERLAHARVNDNPRLQPLWKEWQVASAEVQDIPASASADASAKARTRLESAERKLAQALPQANAFTHRQMSMAELRQAMPAETALVWLHDLKHSRPTDFANAAVDIEVPETWAFVLPSNSVPLRAIRLGPADGISNALARWQQALANPASAIEQVRKLGSQVKEQVWTPIAGGLSARRVFIVAEGPLLRLPWSALPNGDGYLVERDLLFHVLNHEHDLLARMPAAAPPHALLAVADPRGGPHKRSATRECANGSGLPPLPGARREVKRIADLIGSKPGGPSVVTLIGDDAREARFRSEAPRSALLHLATHGFEIGDPCADQGVTRGISLSTDAPSASPRNATTLLFAEPAIGTGTSVDDGMLGSLEIAALDLSKVQWAVLAACSTAGGATHSYEGLYGLARAFRLAGAGTVLLSLWSVDDDATAQWSEALYLARLREHADTPTSMRSAQRAVLAARREAGSSEHPWYWAGFMALGDWR